ncbi:MAG: hypothetical protein VB012_03515 [Erysipelotrichaceae bacterium]|nr:hypothetical protein [Erysipelotrichaceae bacterium]
MSRNSDIIIELARELGFKYNEDFKTVFGYHNGYLVTINNLGIFKPFTVNIAVKKDDDVPILDDIRNIIQYNQFVKRCDSHRFRLTFLLKTKYKLSGHRKLHLAVKDFIEELTVKLKELGYRNCCQSCGSSETYSSFITDSNTSLCPTCFNAVSSYLISNKKLRAPQKDNQLSGYLGAFAGAVLGAALILLFSYLGYFYYSVFGLAMAFLTVKGYELFSGVINKKTILFCCLIMIFIIHFTNRLDWAFSVADYYETDLFSAFRSISYLIQDEYISLSYYLGDLAKLYFFAALGALPVISKALNSHTKPRRDFQLKLLDPDISNEQDSAESV